MWPNPPFPANLVIFTEEIPNGKLHFLCSDGNENDRNIYAVNLKFNSKFNFYKFISNINQVTCGTLSGEQIFEVSGSGKLGFFHVTL